MGQKKIQTVCAAVGLAFAVCLAESAVMPEVRSVYAEEQSGYFDESGMWITREDSADTGSTPAPEAQQTESFSEEDTASAASGSEDAGLAGSYTVASGWTEDTETEQQAGDSGVWIYRQDSHIGETETSTITCSYMDTGYSVLEYEQLREMLTNNLLYNNVNAQISTSAVYTLAKDYLYIVLVDDSSEIYRDIYHYVVGDYRCFCVQVREYRAEAQQMEAEAQSTPQEAGKSMAEGFTWNEF